MAGPPLLVAVRMLEARMVMCGEGSGEWVSSDAGRACDYT